MPNEIEGSPAPGSDEAKAIAELEKDGHTVGDHQPIGDDGEVTDSKNKENEDPEKDKVIIKDKSEEDRKDPPEDNPEKPVRTPTMVEAYKLKIAEDQKETAIKDRDLAVSQVKDLQSKLNEIAGQKTEITQTQKNEISDDIKKIAEEAGVDEEFLTKFADSILTKAEGRFKIPAEVTETIKNLKETEKLNKELMDFSNEFDKDVAPQLAEYNLSADALSKVKNELKNFAFSDTYAKVPLKEIFQLKKAGFDLKEPKRSSEGKQTVKVRTDEVVDFDNLTEEQFKSLTPEQIEKFERHKSGGTWQRK